MQIHTEKELTAQSLSKRLQRQVDSDQEVVNTFRGSLVSAPAHALTWSNRVFASAARLKVCHQVITALAEGSTVVQVGNCLQDRVLHKSRYPAQSTSPTSNLMEQYELAASAEILSDLRKFSVICGNSQ